MSEKPRFQKVTIDYDMVCPDCGDLIVADSRVIYDREKDVEVCLDCYETFAS